MSDKGPSLPSANAKRNSPPACATVSQHHSLTLAATRSHSLTLAPTQTTRYPNHSLTLAATEWKWLRAAPEIK